MKKMVNCLYCKKDLDERTGIFVCDSCGVGVWGKRMFEAIKNNMSNLEDSQK